MNSYIENNCRVCGKCFCCKKCRIKHEAYHKIPSKCDICLHGKAILSRPTLILTEHIEAHHMPLHCLYCEKVFTTMEELKTNCKCLNEVEPNYESPSNVNTPAVVCKGILPSRFATTSTPMQRISETEPISIIQEDITPIDRSDIKSKISSTDQSEKSERPLKRRVTFNDTPIINSLEIPSIEEAAEEVPEDSTEWETAIDSDDLPENQIENLEESHQSNSILTNKAQSLFTNIIHAVMSISLPGSKSCETENATKNLKRPKPDWEYVEENPMKRMKLTEIQCRKSIRPIKRIKFNRGRFKIDKAVQTDF